MEKKQARCRGKEERTNAENEVLFIKKLKGEEEREKCSAVALFVGKEWKVQGWWRSREGSLEGK